MVNWKIGGFVFLMSRTGYYKCFIYLCICHFPICHFLQKLFFSFQKSLVKTTIDGRTTLHLAADYGQLEVLEYLAAQGADINAKDKHGISVILAAIWEGHSKCVKFLLDKVSIDTIKSRAVACLD